MASASSSSSSSTNLRPEAKYDVFLSFRGEDTRDNFTSHLYAALCRKNIETFIDNQLTRGDEISPALLDAIGGSKISVIIFSEGYASSRWCLEELVKILECKNDKNIGQIVVPVFYRVDPSDVRNQTGIFGDGFLKLEERFMEWPEKLESWRIALREAANLSGFASHVIRPESLLIEKIVGEILKRLNDMYPTDNKDLIGVESSIRQIESLLSTGSKDVYTLGIWGIGGIGKTTLAGAIFNRISNQFEGSYFLQNVREESERTGGLSQLRQKLFSGLLEDESLSVGIPNVGLNFRGKRLSRKKIIIVFDDVTCSEQIKFLIGSLDWFTSGSRIIITTRDKQVLKNCRVDGIYEVEALLDYYALQLFSRHAVGQNQNADPSYKELSDRIIKFAQGVPLALKVLGCFLFGRKMEDWESASNKLKKVPHLDIQKVLEASYDGLDDEEQNIFLDIACFFKGEDKDLVVEFLDASGFSAEIGISVLVDKSLIIILKNKITMHDLLQGMGREIVRQESIKDPGKRSRLWNHEDIYHVLTRNKGTETIEGISLDMSKVKDINLNPQTFTKMHKLRFLKFYNSVDGEHKNKVHHFQGLDYVFSELKYFHWNGYPLKAMPSYIHPENLIALEMPHSSVEKLWGGAQQLVNLKYMDLSHSKQLTEIPDLSLASNIEKLNLDGCSSLLEIHPSIKYLNKLAILSLRHCKCIKSFPTSFHLESLKQLFLSGCSNLNTFPEIACTIEELFLDGTAIEELPLSIECLSRLITLNLENCSRLECLSSSFCKLKSLQHLNLSGCTKVERLPDEFGNLEALREMKAERSSIREVPSSIVQLNNLYRLSFEGYQSKSHMGLRLPTMSGLRILTNLDLSDCGITELPNSLGQLSSLYILFLNRNNFERIPTSIIHLTNLLWLDLTYCERLQSLPELPCNISYMDANCCTSLKELSGFSILFTPTIWNSQALNFINCFNLDGDELKEIAKDAQLKIQLMATAWWNEYHKESYETPLGCISFPGSEVPDWFSFQSAGSSTILKLPPVSFSDKFVGIALCVVVAFRDHQDVGMGLRIVYECKLKARDDTWHVAEGSLFDWGDGYSRPRYVLSDHVFLGYDFAVLSNNFGEYCYHNKEAVIEFYLLNTHDFGRSDWCEIKRCAVHLLYARDFGEAMEYPSESFSQIQRGRRATPKENEIFQSSTSRCSLGSADVYIGLVLLVPVFILLLTSDLQTSTLENLQCIHSIENLRLQKLVHLTLIVMDAAFVQYMNSTFHFSYLFPFIIISTPLAEILAKFFKR